MGDGETALWGRPPPTRSYMGVIEGLASYSHYHYDVSKRNQIFLKIEN